MLKWILRRQFAAFERKFGYDMTYAREILDASEPAAMKFGLISGFVSHREDAPLEAFYATRIAGTMQEDCGPCTQLMVNMALDAGVPADVVRRIVARDPAAMTPDAALGFRFAVATMAHDLAADALRHEIVGRWGKKALVSLAFALTASRIFPTLKYALGHGHACMRVRVQDRELQVKPQAV